MANTNFLQFDPQQTNMLSDSNYASDVERSSGFVTGISRSILFNKTLYQSSTMSTALANVLVARGYDAIDNNLASLEDSIDHAFSRGDRGLPIGSIFPTTAPITEAPEGFLLPNGESFDPNEYPDLATVYRIGPDTYKYGQEYKNGVWWPKTPDLRGYFLRVHNPQSSNFQSGITNPDAGRTLGTAQGDAIRNFTGKGFTGSEYFTSQGTGEGIIKVEPVYNTKNKSADAGNATLLSIDASWQVPTANENRPLNVALTYLIVAKEEVNLGTISPQGGSTYKGVYDNSVTYEEGDIVKYNNSFFEALQTTVGNLPNDTSYWSMLSNNYTVHYIEFNDNDEYPLGGVMPDSSGSSYSGPLCFTLQNGPKFNASTGILTAPGLKTTTQSQGDNSTNVATTEYVDTAVAGSQPTYNSSTKTLEF